MEVSVDSTIKKPFCSRNYDKKLEIEKTKKPTPKLNILSCKLGCLKRRLMLVRVIALNFRALPRIFFDKWLHAAANIVEEPEMYRSRSRNRNQANFSGAGLDSELSLTSKLE